MDFRGFGHSEGTRGFIESREQFYEDGYNFIVKARKFYEDLYPENTPPLLTMGYSQGGALGLGIAKLLHDRGQAPLSGQIYVVPNFGIQQDHWTEEFLAELESKKSDSTQTIAFPAKPLSDVSFLMGYIMDELQFKGPHYAVTLNVIKDIADEDKEYFKHIKHPVHVTLANGDNILRNDETFKFLEAIQTPEDHKELQRYDSDHYILSDGWIYEDVIAKQNAWLDRIFPA